MEHIGHWPSQSIESAESWPYAFRRLGTAPYRRCLRRTPREGSWASPQTAQAASFAAAAYDL
jgi:hypothetical protein